MLTGESFTLKYHDMADVLDFLVLRQTYEIAIQRNWKAGYRFRCIIDDLWWEGQVEVQEPYQPNCPDSMFLCYRIRWDNDESDRMGPWDLEPIDPERRPTVPGAGVPVLPAEIASTLYQPRSEDWPPGGDRDAECDRIAAAISQVRSLRFMEPSRSHKAVQQFDLVSAFYLHLLRFWSLMSERRSDSQKAIQVQLISGKHCQRSFALYFNLSHYSNWTKY